MYSDLGTEWFVKETKNWVDLLLRRARPSEMDISRIMRDNNLGKQAYPHTGG